MYRSFLALLPPEFLTSQSPSSWRDVYYEIIVDRLVSNVICIKMTFFLHDASGWTYRASDWMLDLELWPIAHTGNTGWYGI